MSDVQHLDLPGLVGEIDHRFGPRLHVLANPWTASLLARACRPETAQPEFVRLMARLYDVLVTAAAGLELPRTRVRVPTRMSGAHAEAAYEGEALDPTTRVVIAGIARAGTLPAHQVQAALAEVLPWQQIRVDHLFMNRKVDGRGRVVGVDFAGSKVGGSIDGVVLIVPDPMGATGQSMGQALKHYADAGRGRPSRVLALHLIVTPEYVRYVTDRHPEVQIYALRLDRGLSDPRALAARPGELPDLERGLNERQYIVPGAGGIGELISNSE